MTGIFHFTAISFTRVFVGPNLSWRNPVNAEPLWHEVH
jgi:hypothetical protein